ncbi:hypothetical protein ACFQ0M_23705 [Kitasatospora aburaviensis]
MLSQPAEPFGLPAERAAAQTVIDELFAAVDRIGRVHSFAKGMGLAAPQIGIPRAAALVLPRPPAPSRSSCSTRLSRPSPTRPTRSTRDASASSTSAAWSPAPSA